MTQGSGGRWHPDTPDYYRLIEVAEQASQCDDPRTLIGRHINAELVMKAAARRVTDVAEADRKEAPSYRDLITILTNAWTEAFLLAAIFLKAETGNMPEEWRGEFIMGVGSKGSDAMAAAFGGAIDHMRLVDAEKLLRTWYSSGQDRFTEETQKVIDLTTLSFVAVRRCQYAVEQLGATGPLTHGKLNELRFSAFVDGFQRGLIFEELGGHQAT